MMKKMVDDAIKLTGLKNTESRAAILEILKQSTQPMTAEQIFLALKEKNVTSNLSTVYRTLDAFADNNLATKLRVTGESRTLYELNRMVHRHYLICLGCKKIMPIDSCPLKDYETSLAKETNFLISGHRLDIYGYCPECKANI